MVPVDSSMAMMPLPGATMAWATLSRSSILMTTPSVRRQNDTTGLRGGGLRIIATLALRGPAHRARRVPARDSEARCRADAPGWRAVFRRRDVPDYLP